VSDPTLTMRTLTSRTSAHQIQNMGEYRLVRIREADGAQLYEACGQQRERHLWLTGSERTDNVRIDTIGTITRFKGQDFTKHVFMPKEDTCLI
jgi:hypothetical protein